MPSNIFIHLFCLIFHSHIIFAYIRWKYGIENPMQGNHWNLHINIDQYVLRLAWWGDPKKYIWWDNLEYIYIVFEAYAYGIKCYAFTIVVFILFILFITRENASFSSHLPFLISTTFNLPPSPFFSSSRRHNLSCSLKSQSENMVHKCAAKRKYKISPKYKFNSQKMMLQTNH